MSYWLSTPLVPSGTVLSACVGRFRQPSTVDLVLNSGCELHVLSVLPSGKLLTLFRQPVLCHVRDVRVLPFSRSQEDAGGSSSSVLLDHLVALLRTGSLAVLQFNHQLNRFMVITELMLATGSDLERDHLGCRLAVAPSGTCLALAAARGRLACLNVRAAADGVELSEPAVYAAAAPAVAGAVDLDRSASGMELGSIVDLTFFSSGNSSGGGGGGSSSSSSHNSSENNSSGGGSDSSSSSGGVQMMHLAAISYRPGESGSELVLLRWDMQQQVLAKCGVVSLPHRGPEGVLGRPLHLAALPSSPTALVVFGSKALLVLDCSAMLQQEPVPAVAAAAGVASTVGFFDLHIIRELQRQPTQQQLQQHVELPCWLGKCLAPAGGSMAAAAAAAAAAVTPGASPNRAAATAAAAADSLREQGQLSTAGLAAPAPAAAAAAAAAGVRQHAEAGGQQHEPQTHGNLQEQQQQQQQQEDQEQAAGLEVARHQAAAAAAAHREQDEDAEGLFVTDDPDDELFFDDDVEEEDEGDVEHEHDEEEEEEEELAAAAPAAAAGPDSSSEEGRGDIDLGFRFEDAEEPSTPVSQQETSELVTAWAWQTVAHTSSLALDTTKAAAAAAAAAAPVDVAAGAAVGASQGIPADYEADTSAAAAAAAAAGGAQPAVDCLVLATASGLIRLGLTAGPDSRTSLAAAVQHSPFHPPAITILGDQQLHTVAEPHAAAAAANLATANQLVVLPGGQLLVVADSSSTALLLSPSANKAAATAAAAQQAVPGSTGKPAAAAATAAAGTLRVASPAVQAVHSPAVRAVRQLGRLQLESQSAATDMTDMELDSPHGMDGTAHAAAAAAGGAATGQNARGLRSHRLQALSADDEGTPPASDVVAAAAAAHWDDHGSPVADMLASPKAAAALAAISAQPQRMEERDSDPCCSSSSSSRFSSLANRYTVSDQVQLLGPVGSIAMVQVSQNPSPAGGSSSSGGGGGGCSRPVLIAASHRRCKGLRVLTPGTPVEEVLAGPEGMFHGASGMWPIGSSISSTEHRLLIFSFAAASRALSVGACFTDVSDAVGLVQTEPTLLAACVAEGLAVQVTPSGVRLCPLEGLPSSSEEHHSSGSSSSRQWRHSPKSSRLHVAAEVTGSEAQGQQQPQLGIPASSGPGRVSNTTLDSSSGVMQLLPPAAAAFTASGDAAAAAAAAGQGRLAAVTGPWHVQHAQHVGAAVAAAPAAKSYAAVAAGGPLTDQYSSQFDELPKQQQQQQDEQQLQRQQASCSCWSATADQMAWLVQDYVNSSLWQHQQWHCDEDMQTAALGTAGCKQPASTTIVLAAAVPGAVAAYLSNGELVVLHVSRQQQQKQRQYAASLHAAVVTGAQDLQQQQQQQQAAASKKRGRSSWVMAVAGTILLDRHVSCIELCAAPCTAVGACGAGWGTATAAAAAPRSSSSSSSSSSWQTNRSFAQYVVAGSYDGGIRLLAVQQPSCGAGSSSNSSNNILVLATFSTQQLHPLRLLSSLTGNRNSRAAAAAAADQLVSPAVPDSCLFIPTSSSGPTQPSGTMGVTADAAAGAADGVTASRRGAKSAAGSTCTATLLLLVSYRNGDIAVYHIDLLSLLLQQQQQHSSGVAPESNTAAGAAVQHLRVLSQLRLPGAPAKLQLLQHTPPKPAAAAVLGSSSSSAAAPGPPHSNDQLVLAVGDGLWLLQLSRQSHQIKLRHIAAPAAVLAAGLQLPPSVMHREKGSSSGLQQQQQQQHIACVLPTGQLQLLRLPLQHQQHKLQTWLEGVSVTNLLTHPESQKLLAVCNGRSPASPPDGVITPYMLQQPQQVMWLQCLDPANGARLASFQPSGRQSITCVGFWSAAHDAFPVAAAQHPCSDSSSSPPELGGLHFMAAGPGSGSSREARPAAAAAAAGGRGGGTVGMSDASFHVAELLHDLDSPSSATRSKGHSRLAGLPASGTAGHPSWRRVGPLVALGTRASEQEDGCKGQVVVLQLLASQAAAAAVEAVTGTHASLNRHIALSKVPGTTSSDRQQQQHVDANGLAAAAAAGSSGACGSSNSSSILSYSFQRVARLRMPESVSAVCGFSPDLLLVAVGHVLAVYRLQQQDQRRQLQQAAHCFVRAPIVSVSVGEAQSGLVLVADMLQGLAAYQVEVHAVTGQVGIQPLAAHTDIRPVMQVASLPPLPVPVSAAAAGARSSCSSSSSSSTADVARSAAMARSHGLCLDSRGLVLEVSWAKKRVVPVKCLSTTASMPLGGAAAAMQVAEVAVAGGSSSGDDWFCRSMYGFLENEDIQLHWQNPLAGTAAAGAVSSGTTNFPSAAPGSTSGASVCGAVQSAAVAAAGVAASSAIVASQSGAVLHLQKLPAAEGRLLLHLQQLLLQHPLTRPLCIGAEHMLHDELPAGPDQPPVRLGAVDGRVLQQLLTLPGELQLLMLHSAALNRLLPGRLARALQVPELQQSVLDAVLCRLQVLPCWD